MFLSFFFILMINGIELNFDIHCMKKKKGGETRVELKSQRNYLSSRNVCTDSTASKRCMVKVRVWPVSWKLRPATNNLPRVLFQAVIIFDV